MVKKKAKKIPERIQKLRKREVHKKLENDRDIAYDFAVRAYKKFREVIKSIILFGSVVKGETKKGSDIDIVIIIDDCVISWDQELIAWYRQELSELLAEQKYGRTLHLTTVTLTSFMEELRAGEPAVINMIRYGESLVDFGGFFNPLKVLLARGKIRPTTESVFVALRRAPLHIAKAKIDVVASLENLYWSMVDSAHAALMAANQVPPSPEHVAEMLEVTFVNNKKLDKKYVEWFKYMFNLAHEVMHGNIKYISGKEFDKHVERAEEFEKTMRDITSNIIKDQKIIDVKEKKE